MLLLLMSAALTSAALASELAPAEAEAAVVARAADGGGVYYALAPSGSLTWDVEGPRVLEVELRRRVAPVAPGEPGEPEGASNIVRAMADDTPLVQIPVDAPLDPTGRLLDGRGGLPSEATRVMLQVPPGQHRLSLIAIGNDSATLVSLTETTSMAVSMPTPPSDEGDGLASLDIEGEIEDAEIDAMLDALVEVELDAETAQVSLLRSGLALYAGGGFTLAGQPGWSAGVSGQLALSDSAALEASLGWSDSAGGAALPVPAPLGGTGASTLDRRWRTGAAALEPALGVYPGLGGVRAGVIGGPGVYYALRRAEGGASASAVAFGYHARFEVEIPLSRGHLAPGLHWSSARADFGNTAATGQPASERLDLLRADLRWSFN